MMFLMYGDDSQLPGKAIKRDVLFDEEVPSTA